MAKATITCTCPECGTKFAWSVTCQNRRMADSWEEYHADEAETRLCPECYRKQQAAKREQERATENAAAAETADKFGFPALTGTEKQVAWATAIRQQAIDSALTSAAGRTSAGMTDKGRAFVAGVIERMSTDAKWWIDHRADAAHLVLEEIECANWARIDDAARESHMAKLRAAAERNAPGIMGVAAKAEVSTYERYERARLAGRTSMEQRAADEAEAKAAKEAEEAAKRATLPPVPAKLADRLGRPGAKWNGKFYGKDGLRVYLGGEEAHVPAETKAAWEREWTAYKAAKKAAGL